MTGAKKPPVTASSSRPPSNSVANTITKNTVTTNVTNVTTKVAAVASTTVTNSQARPNVTGAPTKVTPIPSLAASSHSSANIGAMSKPSTSSNSSKSAAASKPSTSTSSKKTESSKPCTSTISKGSAVSNPGTNTSAKSTTPAMPKVSATSSSSKSPVPKAALTSTTNKTTIVTNPSMTSTSSKISNVSKPSVISTITRSSVLSNVEKETSVSTKTNMMSTVVTTSTKPNSKPVEKLIKSVDMVSPPNTTVGHKTNISLTLGATSSDVPTSTSQPITEKSEVATTVASNVPKNISKFAIPSSSGAKVTSPFSSLAAGVPPPKFTSRSRTMTPPKLTRQHSLAAMLGLVKNKEMKEMERQRWPPVYEEDESNGSGERSLSMSYVPGQVGYTRPPTPLSMYHRRSSCTGDLPGGVLPPPRLAGVIRRKPTTTAQPPDKRRCSLTLPYATLYGSWQQTLPTPPTPSAIDTPNTSQPHISSSTSISSKTVVSKPTSPSARTENSSAAVAVRSKSSKPEQITILQSSSGTERNEMQSSQVYDNIPLSPNSTSLQPQQVYFLPQLMASSLQKVPMKDFGSEVRASLDIAHFLQTAVLLLDVQDTTLDGVTDLLLDKLLEQDEPMCSKTEAKSILFTTDTGEYHLLFCYICLL